MMTDLVPTSEAPLAIDRDGKHFNPAGAVAWALKRETRGRPGAVREEDGTQVLLPLGATRRDVRKKVKDRPGRYFLVAVDEDGDALDCPQGEIEIAPGDFSPWSPTGSTVEVPARMFDLLEQMIETQKASQFAAQDMIRTLTASIVDQQRTAADLLRAANETIKVASGVDALERQLPAPEVNVEQLAEVLTEELAPDEDEEKPSEGWFTKFMTSPAFPMVANLVNGALQPFMAMQQARMKAAIAAAEAEAKASAGAAEQSAQAVATPASSVSAPVLVPAQTAPTPEPPPHPEPSEPEPGESDREDVGEAEQPDEHAESSAETRPESPGPVEPDGADRESPNSDEPRDVAPSTDQAAEGSPPEPDEPETSATVDPSSATSTAPDRTSEKQPIGCSPNQHPPPHRQASGVDEVLEGLFSDEEDGDGGGSLSEPGGSTT